MIRLLAPLVVAGVTLPVVTGSLPGRPAKASPEARAAGAIDVRELAAVGAGPGRVALLVGRTRRGELCVGSVTFFHCVERVEAQPAYVLVSKGVLHLEADGVTSCTSASTCGGGRSSASIPAATGSASGVTRSSHRRGRSARATPPSARQATELKSRPGPTLSQ